MTTKKHPAPGLTAQPGPSVKSPSRSDAPPPQPSQTALPRLIPWRDARHDLASAVYDLRDVYGAREHLARQILSHISACLHGAESGEEVLTVQSAVVIAAATLRRISGLTVQPSGVIDAMRISPPSADDIAPWETPPAYDPDLPWPEPFGMPDLD